jgi:hypothetical protein
MGGWVGAAVRAVRNPMREGVRSSAARSLDYLPGHARSKELALDRAVIRAFRQAP